MTKRLPSEEKLDRKLARDQERRTRHLLEAQEIAKKKGGKCLASSYVNAKELLPWECDCGNLWEACLNDIKNGRWCPPCGTKRMADGCRGSLKEMQEIAEHRGGKFLGEVYVNANTKMPFACTNTHEFSQKPGKIKTGAWCPQCNGFIGEEICRLYLESIFLIIFPKSRPIWLKTGKNRLELDGYSEPLGIAFEHHGKYHYGLDGYYAKNQEDLISRQEKDRTKEQLCIKYKVKLLVIPEIFSLTPLPELGKVVKKQCEALDIDIPNFQPSTHFDFSSAYKLPYGQIMLEKLQQKASEYEGKCLATSYSGSQILLPFECADGHISLMKPHNVLNGHWCNECNGKAPLTLKDMQTFAAEHGGTCLSPEYKNSKTPLDWKCKHEFPFSLSYVRIKKRKRFCTCKKCSIEAKKVDLRFLNPSSLRAEEILENLKQIARDRKGECLADSYQGMHTPLPFRCGQSHASHMRPVNVLNGSWCNECSGRARLSIEDMQAFAAQYGGTCLSSKYKNNKTALDWKCKHSIIFPLSYSAIRVRKGFCSCPQIHR